MRAEERQRRHLRYQSTEGLQWALKRTREGTPTYRNLVAELSRREVRSKPTSTLLAHLSDAVYRSSWSHAENEYGHEVVREVGRRIKGSRRNRPYLRRKRSR